MGSWPVWHDLRIVITGKFVVTILCFRKTFILHANFSRHSRILFFQQRLCVDWEERTIKEDTNYLPRLTVYEKGFGRSLLGQEMEEAGVVTRVCKVTERIRWETWGIGNISMAKVGSAIHHLNVKEKECLSKVKIDFEMKRRNSHPGPAKTQSWNYILLVKF